MPSPQFVQRKAPAKPVRKAAPPAAAKPRAKAPAPVQRKPVAKAPARKAPVAKGRHYA